MQTSAELRYFWKTAVPPQLEKWFRGGSPAPGGGGTRVDEYLRDSGQAELGIKRRGGKPGVEIKGLVSRAGVSGIAPFTGEVEIWTKWWSEALRLDRTSTIRIEKQRWLRKFDTAGGAVEIPLGGDEEPVEGQSRPEDGCDFELTRLTLPDGAVWWTLGFEAIARRRPLVQNLMSVAEALVRRGAPPFSAELTAGYPRWLSRL